MVERDGDHAERDVGDCDVEGEKKGEAQEDDIRANV